MSDVRFRLIGINQDNRADGTGKAGLTFQAAGSYNIKSSMNTTDDNFGGWRDTLLRKNLNDESTGTIWNEIQSTDFKNNITPVLKATANNDVNKATANNATKTSNTSSITVDKLFILSPSEMSMHIITNDNQNNANAHYYNAHYYNGSSYNNTIKSSSDDTWNYWISLFDYIYSGNAYQWWMLPAGNRTDYITTDGRTSEQQAYHNTDSYSYCTLTTSSNPSTNEICNNSWNSNYWLWLRSYMDGFHPLIYTGYLNLREMYGYTSAYYSVAVVVSFSF